MKLTFFTALIILCSNSLALTCSETDLNFIFSAGLYDTRKESLGLADITRDVLLKSNRAVDQKGVKAPITAHNQFQPRTDKIIKNLAKIISARNPLIAAERAGQIAVAYLISTAADFLEVYSAKDREAADQALYELLENQGLPDFREAVATINSTVQNAINANEKVLIIANNYGALATSKALKSILENAGENKLRLKNVMTYLIEPPPIFGGIPEIFERRHIRFFNRRLNIPTVLGEFKSNVRIDDVMPDFKSSYSTVDEIYFSDTLMGLKIPSEDQEKEPMKKIFVDYLRSGLDELPNKSVKCCGGRAGRLTEVKDVATEKFLLQGYVEDKISYNSDLLSVATNASLCRLDLSSTPVVSGRVDILGRVGLGSGTRLVGPFSGMKKLAIGDSGGGITYITDRSLVEQNGESSLRLKGDLYITNSQIKGNGAIEGEKNITLGSVTVLSSIHGAKLTGELSLKGSYFVESDINGTAVEGIFKPNPFGSTDWTFLGIGKNSKIDKGNSIKGWGYIDGTVKGEGNQIDGSTAQSGLFGISIDSTSTLQGHSKLLGSVLLGNNSSVDQGSLLETQYTSASNLSQIQLSESTVRSSTIFGFGLLNGSNVNVSTIKACGFGYNYPINASQIYGVQVNREYLGEVVGSSSGWMNEFFCSLIGPKTQPNKTSALNSFRYGLLRASYPIPNACLVFGC